MSHFSSSNGRSTLHDAKMNECLKFGTGKRALNVAFWVFAAAKPPVCLGPVHGCLVV